MGELAHRSSTSLGIAKHCCCICYVSLPSNKKRGGRKGRRREREGGREEKVHQEGLTEPSTNPLRWNITLP